MIGIVCLSFFSAYGDPANLLLLQVSIVFQLGAAAQRGIFAAQSSWLRFSAQFVLEGVGRIGGTVFIVLVGGSRVDLLIPINVAVQGLAIFVSGAGRRWLPAYRNERGRSMPIVYQFFPLFFAALAIQSYLTLSPFLSRSIGLAPPIQVAALGGLIQFVRIPVTFSSPMTLPVTNQIAASFGSSSISAIQQSALKMCRLLGLVWGVFAIGLLTIGVLRPRGLVTYDTVIDTSLLAAAAITCLVCPITIFLHSTLLVLKHTRDMTIGWVSGLIIYAVLLWRFGESASGTFLSICSSALVTGSIFAWSIRSL
jgi:hypothetical protein